MGLDELLRRLWEDYSRIHPQAGEIHRLLRERGEDVRNDHVAFRTVDDLRVGLDVLARPFMERGYSARDHYDFPEKKLRARHFEHGEPEWPKVFVSELRLGKLGPDSRRILERAMEQVPGEAAVRPDFPVLGRPWRALLAEYDALGRETEYGAWFYAFGFRANHFTVDVNALKTFRDLPELNEFLKNAGFRLNDAGGEIKGSPDVFLEQSSTMAGETEVSFDDGSRRIPSCYYEFARRYRMPDGRIFQGFVAQSADRIFESTDRVRDP